MVKLMNFLDEFVLNLTPKWMKKMFIQSKDIWFARSRRDKVGSA